MVIRIIDLKAHFHGLRYTKEALKILQKNGIHIKISSFLEKITALGRLHSRTDQPLAA